MKISASGFIHLRTPVERLEYLYGILATTRVTDGKVLATIAEATQRELRLSDLSARSRLQVVETFRDYLLKQATALAKAAGSQFDIADRNSGAAYVLQQWNGSKVASTSMTTARTQKWICSIRVVGYPL